MRRRRIALAMAVLMTVTSIPMNGLTVYAENQAAGDPAVVGTADEPLALAAEDPGVSVGELENDVLIADEPEAALPGDGSLPDVADTLEGDLTVEALEVIEEETEEATETESDTEAFTESETAAQTEAVTEAVSATETETAAQTEVMTEAVGATEAETAVQTEAMTETVAQTERMTEAALQTDTLEAETEILVSETEGLAELEEVMTEGAAASAERTPQSIALSGSETTVDVVDLYSYLSSLEATVTYGEADTEQITEWSSCSYDYDPETGKNTWGLVGYTSGGDSVYLKLVDNQGEGISVPYNSVPDTFPKSGEYTVCAEMSSYSEIAPCQYSITVNGPEQVSTALQVGMSAGYSADNGCYQWQRFTAETAGQYMIKHTGTTGTVPNIALYREMEDGLQRDAGAASVYIGITQKLCTVSLNSGETCYLLLYGDEYNYGSGTADVAKKKEIAGISFSQSACEFETFDAGAALHRLPVTVVYQDGTTEAVSLWMTYTGYDQDENSFDFFGVNTGDGEFIKLYLKKADGSFVSMPGYNGPYIYGSYILRAELQSNSQITAECPVTISGIPESSEQITPGENKEVSVNAKSRQYLVFHAAEDGNYILGYSKTSGKLITMCVYKNSAGQLESVSDSISMSADGELSFHAEKDTEYVISLQNSNMKVNTTGTLGLRKQKTVKALKLAEKVQYDAFTAERDMRDTELIITYDDGEEERLNDWRAGYSGDYMAPGPAALFAESQEKISFMLYMQDSQGEVWNVPIDGSCVTGNYTLVLYQDGIQTGLSQAVEFTLPQAEEITEGETKKGFICWNEIKAYTFTVGEGQEGMYRVGVHSDYADIDYRVYRYDADRNALDYAGYSSCDLTAGTYYLRTECTWSNNYEEAYDVSIVKMRELKSVELLDESAVSEAIIGLDSLPYSRMKAKAIYEGGKEETVTENRSDKYGSRVSFRVYPYNEDGTVNKKKGYRSISGLTPGKYYLAADVTTQLNSKVTNGKDISLVSKETAASRNVISPETAQITLPGSQDCYICASYTPQTDGYYLINADLYLSRLRVFDANSELEGQWVDDYTIRVKMTAGQNYVIAVRAGQDSAFTLTVKPEKKVQDTKFEITDSELVAGLDSFDEQNFVIDLDLGDGETISLNGSDAYADGNGFRYEIKNTETGETVKQGQPLKKGTYQVTAIQRTGSAIYRTGSALGSGSSTGAGEQLTSRPVTVKVDVPDTNKLPVIGEDTEFTLKMSGKRQLFAFTPKKDAIYVLDSEDGWLDWHLYEVTEEGLKEADARLTAGKSYVLSVARVNYTHSVVLTSVLPELKNGVAEKGQIKANEVGYYTFVPEISGEYCFYAALSDKKADFELALSGVSYSWDDLGDVSIRAELEAGRSYLCRLRNSGNVLQDYELTAEKIVEKELESISAAAKSTEGFWAEYAEYYSVDRLVEVTMHYTDGTDATLAVDREDRFGNYTYADELKLISETEKTKSYQCIVRSGKLQAECELTFQKRGKEIILKEGEPVSDTINPAKINIFHFTPEASGEYYFTVEGSDFYYFSLSGIGAEYINEYTYALNSGRTYQLWIYGMEEVSEGSYTVNVTRRKQVTKLELLTPAKPFIDQLQAVGEEMTAKVTYADGTTAVINAFMNADSYGNEISCETRALANGRKRVYLQCGTCRVFCDVEAFDYSSLPRMTEGQAAKIDTSAFQDVLGVFLTFKPEITGTYQMEISSAGEFETGVTYIYNVRTHQYDWSPAELKAGQEYIVFVKILRADADEVGIALKLARDDTDAQDEIDAVDKLLHPEDGTPADLDSAVAKIQDIDNQALIDRAAGTDSEGNPVSAGMDIVTDLETKLVETQKEGQPNVGQTVYDSSAGIDKAAISAEGAAVTVAAEIQKAADSFDAGKTYSAQLSISETGAAAGAYKADISLSIVVKESGQVVKANPALAAPIRITMPVPAGVLTEKTKLYHIVDGTAKQVDFANNGNGTITFCAPSLSPWVLENEHTVSRWNTVQAATCTAEGKESGICDGCQTVVERTIPKAAHTYKLVVDKEATCGAAGSQHEECTVCHDKKPATAVPATGSHTMKLVVDKAATCGAAGSQHEECAVCGLKGASTEIPATGSHTMKLVTDKEATCAEAGSQHEECTVCGLKGAAAAVPATGQHTYGGYEVTKKPTALEAGEETRICSVCKAADKRVVEKLEGTIKLVAKTIPLQLKKSVNLKKAVTGLAEGDSIVSWKSKNKKIATVSKSGKVKGKKTGKTTITVTLASGKTAVITIKVQKKAVKATKITGVSSITLNLRDKKSYSLKPLILPISTLEKVKYSVSGKKVITVSKKGVIKAKKAGKAKVTIRCGKKKKTITVTVVK